MELLFRLEGPNMTGEEEEMFRKKCPISTVRHDVVGCFTFPGMDDFKSFEDNMNVQLYRS